MILLPILALPLFAALISWLLPGRRAAPAVTLAACVTVFGLAVAAALRVAAGNPVVAILNWVAIDGLSGGWCCCLSQPWGVRRRSSR